MINACIVGVGAVGPIHARCAATSKNGCVYAICDIIPDVRIRLRSFIRQKHTTILTKC